MLHQGHHPFCNHILQLIFLQVFVRWLGPHPKWRQVDLDENGNFGYNELTQRWSMDAPWQHGERFVFIRISH